MYLALENLFHAPQDGSYGRRAETRLQQRGEAAFGNEKTGDKDWRVFIIGRFPPVPGAYVLLLSIVPIVSCLPIETLPFLSAPRVALGMCSGSGTYKDPSQDLAGL